jgi:hypothetical protein
MRILGPVTLLLILVVVLFSGCLQSPAPAPAPAPAAPAPSTVAPAAAEPEPRQINVTAWETETNVILRYDGGKDADKLYMFRVQIDNRDGKIVKTPIYKPEVGRQYDFAYIGIPNPNTMNVVAVFNDGSEQTVLFKYF